MRAGRKESFPMGCDCYIAGTSRLQIEAATMTPDAKPVRDRCTILDSSFFIRNTQAEPAVVPTKGIRSPKSTLVFIIDITSSKV